MKAKKLAVVVVGACALLLVFALAGCGAQTPTQVTSAGLDAIKAQNTEALAKYSDTASDLLKKNQDTLSATGAISALGEKSAEISKKMLEKMYDFDYTLGEEKIDGDKATVAVELKTYDVGKALSTAYKEYMSEAKTALASGKSQSDLTQLYADKVIKNLDGLTSKDASCNITVNLSQSNGQWKLNNLLTDVFTPLYQASMQSLINSAKDLAASAASAASNASSSLQDLQNSIDSLTK